MTGPSTLDKTELSLLFTDQIKVGLARAAQKMGAWIVTNGSRDGVASVVGHSVNEAGPVEGRHAGAVSPR